METTTLTFMERKFTFQLISFIVKEKFEKKKKKRKFGKKKEEEKKILNSLLLLERKLGMFLFHFTQFFTSYK